MVEEYDPLGALASEDQSTNISSKKRASLEGQSEVQQMDNKKHLFTDQPILFRGHRSQTFDESINAVNKSMQRSETMPANSVTSSLANSIKFFG